MAVAIPLATHHRAMFIGLVEFMPTPWGWGRRIEEGEAREGPAWASGVGGFWPLVAREVGYIRDALMMEYLQGPEGVVSAHWVVMECVCWDGEPSMAAPVRCRATTSPDWLCMGHRCP